MAVTINGDGLIQVDGTSTTQGRVRLAEDTDNGTNYIELTAPASVTANRIVTFPDNTGTVVTTGSTAVVTQAMLETLIVPIGVGQTWQNVAGSRAKRTTYQNTTGKPIVVAVSFVSPFTSVLQLWTHSSSANILVDGVMIMQADGGDYYSASAYTNHPANVSAVIANNYYYQLYDPNNDVTINFWTELRA